MARKFISFLGTGNYQPCKYRLHDAFSSEVTFIQEALADQLCRDYKAEDSICIFVTKEAKKKYWQDLHEKLTGLNMSCKIIPIDIADSKTEADIWNLFQTYMMLLRSAILLFLT